MEKRIKQCTNERRIGRIDLEGPWGMGKLKTLYILIYHRLSNRSQTHPYASAQSAASIAEHPIMKDAALRSLPSKPGNNGEATHNHSYQNRSVARVSTGSWSRCRSVGGNTACQSMRRFVSGKCPRALRPSAMCSFRMPTSIP